MASIDRYKPPREEYQLPAVTSSRSPSTRRDIPPAAPSPPVHTSLTSPPPPSSRTRTIAIPSQSPSQTARSTATDMPTSRPITNQWFFTPSEILSTPSILEGLTPAEEKLRRAKGVNFIIQAGLLLDLPMTTVWVAALYFHRFYMRSSMVEEKGGIHHYNIAATGLFLANKTEENCKKTKDLIIAVAKVAQKNSKLIIDEQSKEYWRWRDSIITYEEVMLEVLTFDLMVDDPYKQLLQVLRRLKIAHSKPLRELAWAFCNDTCLATLPLLQSGHDIALAAVYFASVFTDEKIDDGAGGEPWWKVVRGDQDKLTQAINVMMDFYTSNPFGRTEARYHSSPVFSLDSTRRMGEAVISPSGGGGTSYVGTPLDTDRRTASPARTNGQAELKNLPRGREKAGGQEQNGDVEMASRGDGDSDAALKIAADSVELHRDTAANGAEVSVSNGTKRKDGIHHDDGREDAEIESKRARRRPEIEE